MGDFHFVVRHALTGVVLFSFGVCGLWLRDPELAYKAVSAVNSQSAVALAVTPVFGILIQSIYLLLLVAAGRMFNDPARAALAQRVRQLTVESPNISPALRENLRRASNDSLFVWLYHENAQSHLIEWARRRRSYHYLGVNWIVAAVLGIGGGLAAPNLLSVEYAAFAVVAFLAVWIGGALVLAIRMRRDVDGMELAWACSRLHPEIKPIDPGQPTAQRNSVAPANAEAVEAPR